MNDQEFKQVLLKQFPHEPTPGQAEFINKISGFSTDPQAANVFVLKGYAGTGKTTIISALIKSLPAIQKKSILLAPTGRAAKVLSNYSQKQAFTIHKKIYKRVTNTDGIGHFVVQPNLHTHAIFIVDEASMISNGGGLSGSFADQSSLLDDLVRYVTTGTGCKLIFVGDTAQLPPVGLSLSSALDVEYLKSSYSVSIDTIELKDVMRQNVDSGILSNATSLRNNIASAPAERSRSTHASAPLSVKFILDHFKDVVRLSGNELEDSLNSAYSKHGVEGTVVICRSNKRANQFNQQIRARIRWQESELSTGDYMMVVKNNYHWLPDESKAGFIANGDIIELLKVGTVKEQYGFRFADARIRMVDYPDEQPIEVKLLLDTIAAETPALTSEQNKKLYEGVLADYTDIADRRKRLVQIKKDPFFNALQVKFAYAITCHKAQGGQWETVFVDQGYLTKEMVNTEFLRWLYTAVTRATEKLYLVNFNKEFFAEE
ncbi:MAG: AAA family ATPase [Bacteroidetes bacterium]|nr:AAA family ATPase [Bacteroidota bacterium]